MLALIKNYKGLVQLKMNLMIYIKQACSTAFDVNVFKAKVLFSSTVEPRLSGPRLSGLFDYPDFCLRSQSFHEY